MQFSLFMAKKRIPSYFSKDAYAKPTGDNKELMIIPGAVHTDLYDQMDIILFDQMEDFFRTYLVKTWFLSQIHSI